MKVGRNLPCPCGSGRKYKHCCRASEPVRASPATDHGPAAALQWLNRRFKDQPVEALQLDFFSEIDLHEGSQPLRSLRPDLLELLEMGINDFLLCDALYTDDEDEARGIDWVLDECPRLSAAQREHLLALADAPLRLYEVMAVDPGVGLELRDMLDPTRSPDFVRERSATLSLTPGHVFGARVLHLLDHRELSGVLYPFSPMVGLRIMDRVKREIEEINEVPFEFGGDDESETDDSYDAGLANGRGDSPAAWTPGLSEPARGQAGDAPKPPVLASHTEPSAEAIAALKEVFAHMDPMDFEALDAESAAHLEDELAAPAIRTAWLQSVLNPQVPQIVDRATGESICLIEDDYQVSDPEALATALAACADVVGDASRGWSRIEDPEAEMSSTLSAINTTDSPDRVTLFHRTQAAAEAGREWFEAVAGAHVTPRARRISDPREVMGGGATVAPFVSAKIRSRPPELAEFSPEQMTAMLEQTVRRTYANWCEEPIPALDHQTPRQCCKDFKGRERVRFLLRNYEHNERLMSEEQLRAPVSYEFLWSALPLTRTEQ